MPETFLITGGAGYLGSHVIAALAARGYRVVVFDAAGDGATPIPEPQATAVAGSLTDRGTVRALFAGHRFDGIVHFGRRCRSSVAEAEPFHTLDRRLREAINLLEAAVDNGVRRVVLSCGGTVFGLPGPDPIDETFVPWPVSIDGEAQAMIERMLIHAGRLHGLRTVSLRCAIAAGADPECPESVVGEPDAHVLPAALRVAAGKQLFVEIAGIDHPTADGTLVRDYVHVCDLADAHVRAVEADVGGHACFNVGLGRGHSAQEVLAAVRRVTRTAVPSRSGPRATGEPAVLVLNADRIRTTLGWSPRFTTIDQIVRTAWEWRTDQRQGPRPRIAAA
jgi:UDP-glucose 4-epimerase